MKRLFIILLLCIPAFLPNPGQAEQARRVVVLHMEGVISPVTAEYLDSALARAASEKAEALVVMLDTPGGLDTSMRQMVKAIVSSQTPVITYVAPSGARAASAGVFITMASHVAAMAPGTNIGAAHPVSMGGGKMDKEMSAKVENDAAAYIRSLAAKYGRNADWAEEAVRKSVSIPESEAVAKGVVDMEADDLASLLAKVDGRKVATAYGDRVLHTKGASAEQYDMGARLRFLRVISDPNVAYILMMIGLLGIYFELSNPGLIFPGVVGGISLILAFYSFQTLPVNYAGVMLIILAVIMFIAEIKVTSYGLLAVGGVISLLLGSVLLINSPLPYMRISFWLILPAVATITAFFVVLMRVAIKAQRSKPTMGPAGLVGRAGEARTELAPEGDVFVQGAHWSAYSDEVIKAGEKVVVVAVEGLKLKVKKAQ